MSNILKTVSSIVGVVAFICLFEFFIGLENESRKEFLPRPGYLFESPEVIQEIEEPVASSTTELSNDSSRKLPGNISKVTQRSHAQDCPKNWEDYAEIYQAGINNGSKPFTFADGVSYSETTSPKFSTITILDKRAVYNLCDVLLVRIQSRDWNNSPKTYGGDFFRSKIFHEKPYSAASEDAMIDFLNGTYLALFTLRWTGEIKVRVQLIHPVEALPQMKRTLSGKVGRNITFLGEFVSGNISEDVNCRMYEMPGPVCNLSNPRTHGPWYCQRPSDSRLSCEDWRYHKMSKATFLKLEDYITPLSRKLLTKSQMVDIKNSCKIKVVDSGSSIAPSTLPFCTMNRVPNGVHTSGHFYQDTWYPDNCRLASYTPESGIKCLRNKTVVILGDSTTRQIYTFFLEKYKKYFKELPLPEGAIRRYGRTSLESTTYNASVHFGFHGLPRAGNSLVLRTDFIEFIADRLNSRRDGCNVIYVISVWAHFISCGQEFYHTRLLSIKSAIEGFLDRCPEGKVIIKGANTKSHRALWISIVSSEWNILKHEMLLRSLFQNETRVGFIDVWDITKVQPYPDNVHPNEKIVKQLIDRILTYLCKS